MTPSEIKYQYQHPHQDLRAESRHFFDRGTMKFFGDTMRSFGVRTIGGETYLYRKPTAYVNVFGKWQVAGRQFFNAWKFDYKTKDLNYCNDEETESVYSVIAGSSYSELS